MDTARRCSSPTTTAEKLSPSMETDWHCISLTIEPVPLWTQLSAVQVQQQQQKSCASPSMETARRCTSLTTTAEKLYPKTYIT